MPSLLWARRRMRQHAASRARLSGSRSAAPTNTWAMYGMQAAAEEPSTFRFTGTSRQPSTWRFSSRASSVSSSTASAREAGSWGRKAMPTA